MMEKIEILHSHMNKKGGPDFDLRDWEYDAKNQGKIKISNNELLIMCGIYLDCTYIHGLLYQPNEQLASQYSRRFQAMQDGRSKESKALADAVYNTREFFDLGGAEGNSSSIEKKREKFKKIYREKGIEPSKIFYFHTFTYKSMKNYEHVLNEAPYSCFALCFQGGKLIVPEIKEYYNQTNDLDKMKKLDFEKYRVS